MRAVDPQLQLIAWGDDDWAGRMIDEAGELIQMVAFHQMFNPDRHAEPVLAGQEYRRDPAATWQVLMEAWELNDRKIRKVRESLGSRQTPLAMTECHFAIPGRNRCDVLSTWAAGVSYARILNNHQRHGDVLKIATAADFCGTRWQVNAVMIPVPAFEGSAYLMPVARVMQLYRQHIGERAVTVVRTPPGLDVTASRTGDTLFLHVVNSERLHAAEVRLEVRGARFKQATAYQIADDPMTEVSQLNAARVMQAEKKELPTPGAWKVPAASVMAIELIVDATA